MPVTSDITGADFPTGNISSIAAGSSDDTLLVTFSNYGIPSVWLSCDGGGSWTDKEGNLPDIPIRWAILYPGRSKNVLLATKAGVWSTSDLHQQDVVWTPEMEGMPTLRTDMLDFRLAENTVLAATHGRGYFTATWNAILSANNMDDEPAVLYPNPTTGPVCLGGITGSAEYRVSIMDQAGRMISERVLKAPGCPSLVADLSSASSGIYIIHVEAYRKTVMTGKIIKN
jgi:hypothetical protein